MIYALWGTIAVLIAAAEWAHLRAEKSWLESNRRLLDMVESQNSLLRVYAGGDAPKVVYQPVEVVHQNGAGVLDDDPMPPLLNEMLGAFGEGDA